MQNLEIEAYIFGKKIGDMLLKDGRVFFEYDKEFQSSGLEISPLKLPLSIKGAYTNIDDNYFEGVAGVFYDTLPDKFGTKVIERYFESKNIPPYRLNVLQKFMFIGDKSIGAIEYKPNLYKLDSKKAKELIELDSFYKSAKKVLQGDAKETIEEMIHFTSSAVSAGGARAKAIIGYDEKSKKIISGATSSLPPNYEHYIIKFDIEKDDGSSSDWTKLEYLYMSMAKEIGINIPDIKLLSHDNLFHYLIKRFDRVGDKKLHLHSVAGLTHTNFNIPKHYSYDELLRLTRYLTSSQEMVNELFKRMVFNIIGRNQDDHAKNFAFLMDSGGKWSLSPAYDITFAAGEGYTKYHQLSVRGKVDGITKDDMLSLAQLHSIKRAFAKEVIESVFDIFQTFEKRASELDIDRKLISEIVAKVGK